MIAHLKASRLGKWLYRLSRWGVLGKAVRWFSRRGVFEVLDAAHFKPENRRHNTMQARRLANFRSQYRQPR